jgi:predicted nucleic acid-binding protein
VNPAAVVLDASAAVDLLLRAESAPWIRETLGHRDVHAPGHFHGEVLNAFGRMYRAGEHTTAQVDVLVRALMTMPVVVSPAASTIEGAWRRRGEHSLADALYVELAAQLGTVVITTDRRLSRATPLAVAPPE